MARNSLIIVVALAVGIAVGASALFYYVYMPTTGKDISDSTPIEVSFAQFGGFVPVDLARQETHIFSDGNVIVFWEGPQVTSAYVRQIPRDDLESLARWVDEIGFYDLESKYTAPDGVIVADAGVGELTVKIGDREKEVVIDPNVDDYLPQNLLSIINEVRSIAQNTVEIGEPISAGDLCRYFDCSGTEADAKVAVDLAQEFISESSTYLFDGISGRINVTDVQTHESWHPRYVVTVIFESGHAGYGDRSGQMLAQVVTPHTAVVTVMEGEVVSAVIDGRWDELSQESVIVEGQHGVLVGRVSIGPLCPVEPCPGPTPDVYSSREIVLQPQSGEPIRLSLNADGSFEAQVKSGVYTLDLTDCSFLGCPRELPRTVTIVPGNTTEIMIDIDTGIR
jgi:hypothetical protein